MTKAMSKGTGIIIMVVLIIAGSFIGGFLSINSMYGDVVSVFENGEKGNGICVLSDLRERASCGNNLVTIAQRYPEIDSSLSSEVSSVTAEMNATDSPSRLYTLNTKLETAFTALYDALDSAELSGTDESLVAKQYGEFLSRANTIQHDYYNTCASEYNSAVSGFPANLICLLTPARKAVLFY